MQKVFWRVKFLIILKLIIKKPHKELGEKQKKFKFATGYIKGK